MVDPHCKLCRTISKTAELLALPEVALVLVRLDHVASGIVNADRGISKIALISL